MPPVKTPKNRVFYRQATGEVVVELDGEPLAVYSNTGALIEAHIKGILAEGRLDKPDLRDIIRKYKSSDPARG